MAQQSRQLNLEINLNPFTLLNFNCLVKTTKHHFSQTFRYAVRGERRVIVSFLPQPNSCHTIQESRMKQALKLLSMVKLSVE